jgi:hypothetical protein
VVHRDHRRADHRLVLEVHQPQQIRREVPAVHGDQVELHTERSRRGLLEGALVDDVLVGEVHAKGTRRAAGAPGERGDRARVDAAAEERGHGHVGEQLVGDHLAKERAQRVDPLARALARRGEITERPVRAPGNPAAPHTHALARAHLLDVPEERPLEQRRVKVQVLVERGGVDGAGDLRALEQRLDLACKENPAAVVVEVELLHPERVARKGELTLRGVPVREGEDARDVREGVGAAQAHQVQQRLGVRRAAERHAPRRELGAVARVVVELAVVGEARGAVGREHRLAAGG